MFLRSGEVASTGACSATTAGWADAGSPVTGAVPGVAGSSRGNGIAGKETAGSGTAGTGTEGKATAGIGVPGRAGATESTTERTTPTVSVSTGDAWLLTVAMTSIGSLRTASTLSSTVAVVVIGSGTAATGRGTAGGGSVTTLVREAAISSRVDVSDCSSKTCVLGKTSGSGSAGAALAVPAPQISHVRATRTASNSGRAEARQRSRSVPPIRFTPQWQWQKQSTPGAVSASRPLGFPEPRTLGRKAFGARMRPP
jgi:hypothetical protein